MYNRSEIMKNALRKHHRFGWRMADALRVAWMEAKDALPIWGVYGDGEKLADGLTYERAGQLQDMYKYRYWDVIIKAA